VGVGKAHCKNGFLLRSYKCIPPGKGYACSSQREKFEPAQQKNEKRPDRKVTKRERSEVERRHINVCYIQRSPEIST